MQQRLDANDFNRFFTALIEEGYSVIGPRLQDQAIVYSEIQDASELPKGWIDHQEPGKYRLEKKGHAYFAYTIGPNSWKSIFLPPKQKLYSTKYQKGVLKIDASAAPTPKLALLGVRACELAAIQVQDRVLGQSVDSYYTAVRERALIIAVQCTRSTSTCFCVSMQTGPVAKSGFDIALTEVVNDNDHFFVLESGSAIGEKLLAKLNLSPASPSQISSAQKAREPAATAQTRELPLQKVRDALPKLRESSTWEKIATQCLSCANCTMVCPTCFCTTVEDTSDLTGENAERWKKWDSCFHNDFSYIHGGSVRVSTQSKYRQWMTHKLSTWWDQFGTSGCVGCGRCVTWCPVGIDISVEAQNFVREAESNGES